MSTILCLSVVLIPTTGPRPILETDPPPAPAPSMQASTAFAPPSVPTLEPLPPTPTRGVPAAAETPSTYYLPRVEVFRPALPRNVILLIGDGMGLEHVRAGGMYANGAAGTLPFEQFPLHAQMSTYSASSAVTDSAAAASAVATGQKVNNRVISEARPGDGAELYTLLELARDLGRATGLVTTTPITDATPAGFGAHTDNRGNAEDIAYDYLHQTRPNVLFGGGHPAMTTDAAQAAGYTVVTDRAGLLGLDTEAQTYLSGQFGHSYLPYEVDGLGGLPHLSEMARSALNVLDNDPDGFFLMIEGGRIDTASHNQETARMVGEMAEFARTAQVVVDWAQAHPGTVIIVLADHETGGLQVTQDSGAGVVPTVIWGSAGHTASHVGVWISGIPLERLPEPMDNAQIFNLLVGRPVQ